MSDEELEEQAASGYMTAELATRAITGHTLGIGGILPNPDKILREQGNSIETYRELMKETKVGGDIRSRKAGVLSMKWQINQGDADDLTTEHVRANIEDLDMHQILSEVLNGVFFGYQPFEIVWAEPQPRTYTVDRFVAKPPEWFAFNELNQLLLLTLMHPEGFVVPPRKFILAQHEATFTNPYGHPILSECFWPVKIKKGGWRWWTRYVETFGIPIVKVIYVRDEDPVKNAAKLVELQRRAVAMASSGIMLVPKGSDAEIMTAASGSNGGHHKELKNECDAEIGNVIVGHNGASESTPGKLGGEDAAMAVRGDIIESDKRLCEQVINKLIDMIYEANWPGIPATARCRFEIYRDEDVDMNLASRDKILTEQGVRFKKIYYVNNYQLKQDEFEVGDPQPLSGGVPPSFSERGHGHAPNCPRCTEFAETSTDASKYPDQKAIDTLASKLTPEQIQFQAEAFLKPVLDLIANASDYNEVMEGLAGQYPSMNTGDLQAVLERAIFISDVIGRVAAETEAAGE